MQTESFEFAGPAGRLEAVLMQPEGESVAAAVVCHAHPLHGGMMHFKPVFRAAKALQSVGLAVLRFNFRGVGRSEGVHDDGIGEQDDVRAALDQMHERFAGQPLVLGGFSFGAAMALRVAARDDRVRAVLVLGFPSSMSTALQSFGARGRPLLFVQGERDTLGPAAALSETVCALPEPRQLVIVPAADHFFTGHLDVLQDAVSAWAGRRPWQAA